MKPIIVPKEDRGPGYYWIVMGDSTPMVAQWSVLNLWLLPGVQQTFPDRPDVTGIQVLSYRLELPYEAIDKLKDLEGVCRHSKQFGSIVQRCQLPDEHSGQHSFTVSWDGEI